jgi:hypothetical protein
MKDTKVDVNLGTVEAIEAILRDAEGPVTRYYVRAHLKQEGRSTTPARLNRALGYLFAHALAIEGTKGIQWTHSGSASLRRAIATGKRL